MFTYNVGIVRFRMISDLIDRIILIRGFRKLTLFCFRSNGHLAVLQYAHANGCGFDGGTCWAAAEGGHLAVLQWLRANGCGWDADTCSYAAAYGHLEVLKWAVANGCPFDKAECLETALDALEDTAAVVEWIGGCDAPFIQVCE